MARTIKTAGGVIKSSTAWDKRGLNRRERRQTKVWVRLQEEPRSLKMHKFATLK